MAVRHCGWQTWVMTSREDVHRLVEAVPAVRLPEVEQFLRAILNMPPAATPRRFASAGTLSAEPDLAERSEGILRYEHVDGGGGGRGSE